MHRDGLFFDPLQDEAEAPVLPEPVPEPERHRRPDPEKLHAQRLRELARVQDELKRMAQGSPGR